MPFPRFSRARSGTRGSNRPSERSIVVTRLRNRTDRTHTAGDYFATFDAVRRAVRDRRQDDITTESRALADVAVRMELYFDEPVTVAMGQAEHALGLEQPQPDAAKTARDSVIKREL